MSIRWNADFYIAMEHKDLQANAMALNNTGSYVLLAGRRYIAIRNLDDTHSEDNLKKFPRQSKYDVGSAEWNHTDHNSELCVISCNQRLEVLTWRLGELTQTHSLKAHTRVITDLNWHRTDPNLLASCSVDTFIHIWDLRDSRRPASSLSAIAEASQVRWNYKNPHLLATAHDGDIKLWDTRKGTAPVLYISAHLAKIYGLDWNPNVETQLTTSSQDNTVKFFDIHSPKRPEYILNTSAPVWRARYTPFGTGLVTVVVPQLRRGENSLLLWNTTNRSAPVHTFMGHRDVVLEFEWRRKKSNESDYQLVTWSKDQSLLVWRIEPYLQKLCGCDAPTPTATEVGGKEMAEDVVEGVEAITKYTHNIKQHALQQEFSLMNVQIPNLDLIKMDVIKRTCTVRAKTPAYLVNLQVNFPPAYPNHVAPIFQVIAGSSIDEKASSDLIQTLAHIAQQLVAKNRTCLEPCLRQLVTSLEQFPQDSNKMYTNANNYMEAPTMFGSYNDAYIPFPRTSGAKFSSVSTLVCFGRPQLRRTSTKLDAATPRALSALGSMFGAKRSTDQMSVSLFYYQKQRPRTKSGNSRGFRAMVVVYDTSALSLINRTLARQYILDGDVGTICKYNANAAAKVGRRDLVQAWTLAELAVSPLQAEEDMSSNPLGSQLMQSLIDHYASQNDIQMAAMLSCIFGKDHEQAHKKQVFKTLLSPTSGGGSPYHTIPPADVVAEGWVFPIRHSTRSNSLDNLKIEEYHEQRTRSDVSSIYEYYKLAYAETLHRWGLLYNRAEVLKFMCTPMDRHQGVVVLADCPICARPPKQCNCTTCNRIALTCVVCHVAVRGSANCCLVCGHGGHTLHMQRWFADQSVCPSGCGCRCLMQMGDIFHKE